jgi:UDP-3-O-[3-hydroxymyristoyl] glucosamine N-acyltransferase
VAWTLPKKLLTNSKRKNKITMPTFPLGYLADLIGAELKGDSNWQIERLSVPLTAQVHDLVFLLEPRWLSAVADSEAQAVLVAPELWSSALAAKNCLLVPEVRPALAALLRLFHNLSPATPGIHSSAVIGADCVIDPSACIGPFCVLEKGAVVGARAVLKAHVCVGQDTRIGADCLIYPCVTLYDQVSLGERVIIHSGSVLGADGYGFYFQAGEHHKIPQIGGVAVEDDVEIGAHVTIDRGTVGQTRIGAGTKIDNQVQIGHNVQIGQHCLLVAQTGISGSTVLGNYVTLAGQTGVAGHLQIGDGVIAAGKSGITQDIPAGLKISGYPAQDHWTELKQQASLRRLPSLLRQLKSRS